MKDKYEFQIRKVKKGWQARFVSPRNGRIIWTAPTPYNEKRAAYEAIEMIRNFDPKAAVREI